MINFKIWRQQLKKKKKRRRVSVRVFELDIANKHKHKVRSGDELMDSSVATSIEEAFV